MAKEKLGEQEIQNAVGKYFPLALRLAKQQQARLPSGINELDDLIGAASVGLVSCLRTYDPSLRTSLTLWVSIHVRGALLDYLRSLDPLPQKERELVKLVREAEAYLEQWLQRKPTPAEIAALLEYAEAEVEHIMQRSAITQVSLEAEEDSPLLELGAVGLAEKVTALRKSFATLTKEEKVAVSMHFDGKPLREIADTLQMSVATAGRRVSEALHQLKACL